MDSKKFVCPGCGTLIQPSGRFCPECGMNLEAVDVKAQSGVTPYIKTGATKVAKVAYDMTHTGRMIGTPLGIYTGLAGPDEDGIPEPEPIPPKGPDDSGLKLIVDYCRKVLATAVGDGHDETVLYLDEKTGQYQIHVYSKPAGVTHEWHTGFAADPAAYDAVMKHIRETDLAGYDGRREAALCGGEVVVKFWLDDKFYRISTDNVPYEHHGDLDMVGRILGSFIDKEKELH